MDTDHTDALAYPPDLAHMKGAVHVAHKAVEHVIAARIPAGNKTRKALDRVKEVVPAHARGVKQLHQDRCAAVLQLTIGQSLGR